MTSSSRGPRSPTSGGARANDAEGGADADAKRRMRGSGTRAKVEDVVGALEDELAAEREARARQSAEYERRIAQLEDRVHRQARDRARIESFVEDLPVGVVFLELPSRAVELANREARAILRGPHVGAFARAHPVSNGRFVKGLRVQGAELAFESGALGERIARGETIVGEELPLVPDDDAAPAESRTVRMSAAPRRDDAGAINACVLVFDDVTEEKAIRTAREQGDRFRDLFLGMLGHDLRTPLAAIVSIASLMKRRGDLGPASAISADKIVASGERISRMIDQLLDLTRERLGGGIPVDRTEVVDLGAVAARIVDEIEAGLPAEAKGRVDLERTGDLKGRWDGDRLAQVFSNLVANAVAYGAPNVPIRVALSGTRPDRVAVSVWNAGTPIPRELVPTIFDPFRRAERKKKKGARGLGLGLYIAQRVVVAHDSAIDVTSDENGTRFGFSLSR